MKQELPYITAKIPGIGGKIRELPEYFVVDEVLLYEPCGTGEHLFVKITKKNITTRELQESLAKLFCLKPKDIGCAGMKDKYAVTTQTFSIRLGKLTWEEIPEVIRIIEERLPVKVRDAKLHRNKLRIGHLLGNKFRIVVTGIKGGALERAKKIIGVIERKGLPNFYGPQRFGIKGENIERGFEIIKGKRKVRSKWLRRLFISSYQSYLCNLYLAERVSSGLFEKILNGDIAKKYETGGMFIVENQKEEQRRYDAGEISFTAPIYGAKMWQPMDKALELENEVLEKSEVTMEELVNAGARGTRRIGRIFPKNLRLHEARQGIEFSFFLPKGAFATTLLREIMKVPDEELVGKENNGNLVYKGL